MDTRLRRVVPPVVLFSFLAATTLTSCTGTRKEQVSTPTQDLSGETCCEPLRAALAQAAQESADDAGAADDGMSTFVVSLVNELDVGAQEAEEIAAKYEVSESADLTAIVQRLAHFADRPALNYDVKVLGGTPDINAFSLLGGRLYITKPLLEQMEPTEGELAAILAHEMAHAALRHVPAMMERLWWSNTLIKMQLCHAASQGRIAGSAVCPAFEALGIAEQNINIEAEFAADQFGALYMVQAGYKLSDAESALQKLLKLKGNLNQFGTAQGLGTNSITSLPTHPPLLVRIDQLGRFRNQLLQVARSVETAIEDLRRREYESAAEAFRRSLQLFSESQSIRLNLALTHHLMYRSTRPAQPWSRGTLSDPQSLEVKWTDLLMRGGGPSYGGDEAFKRAVDGYRAALERDPEYYPARNNLAVAYLDSGNTVDAIIELERALASNREFAPAYRNLSLAFLGKLDASAGASPIERETWVLQTQRAWLEYKTLQPETDEADADIEARISELEAHGIESATRQR